MSSLALQPGLGATSVLFTYHFPLIFRITYGWGKVWKYVEAGARLTRRNHTHTHTLITTELFYMFHK